MEDSKKNILGRRLKLARQKEGITLEELSRITGSAVSKQTISKYEAGKVMPGSRIVLVLAKALKVDVEYFFRPFSFDMDAVSISFRKKANLKAKTEASLKSNIQNKVENYLELEKILNIDNAPDTITVNIPSSINSELQMKKLACEVRRFWDLGIAPIGNANELLISHGIKVFDVDGPDGFDGVSGKANAKTWIIAINKNIVHVERIRLTKFHEFAHLLANPSFDKSLTHKEREDLCNVFASEMLLPSQVLIETFGNKTKISFQELVSLQCTYGISVDAIMYSLKRLLIISDKRYRSFCIRKNMNETFKEEVERSRFKESFTNIQMPESEVFTNMVYSALAQELITPSRAAEFLHCPITEVESKAISL